MNTRLTVDTSIIIAVIANEPQGQVRIRRRDGQVFLLVAESAPDSPLDVEGIDLGLTAEKIIAAVRDGRER